MARKGHPYRVNQYGRSVRRAGNIEAQEIVSQVYEVADRPWRGLGTVPEGGLVLRPGFAQFDATKKFRLGAKLPILESQECRSGEVLTGRMKPPECTAFGTRCTPDSPLGAPMVSSEGACATYYRYRRGTPEFTTTRGAELGAVDE